MKRPLTPFCLAVVFGSLVLAACRTEAAPDWKPAGDRIMTRWAAEVDPAAPLAEYPRPQMTRGKWANLNGL